MCTNPQKLINSLDMAGNDVNAAVFLARNMNVINLIIPYWQYEKFDLDEMSNDECKSEVLCEKRDISNLKDVLHFPEEIITYNRLNGDAKEAICILLKRVMPLQVFGYSSKICKTSPGNLCYLQCCNEQVV